MARHALALPDPRDARRGRTGWHGRHAGRGGLDGRRRRADPLQLQFELRGVGRRQARLRGLGDVLEKGHVLERQVGARHAQHVGPGHQAQLLDQLVRQVKVAERLVIGEDRRLAQDLRAALVIAILDGAPGPFHLGGRRGLAAQTLDLPLHGPGGRQSVLGLSFGHHGQDADVPERIERGADRVDQTRPLLHRLVQPRRLAAAQNVRQDTQRRVVVGQDRRRVVSEHEVRSLDVSLDPTVLEARLRGLRG